jgi:hypothetical protein
MLLDSVVIILVDWYILKSSNVDESVCYMLLLFFAAY